MPRLAPLTALAAGLMGVTVLIHVYMGGPEYHDQYQTIITDPGYRAMAAVLWHAVTVVLVVLTGGLLWLARGSNPPLELALAGIQVGFALLFIWYGLSRLGTLWPMPQWLIFLGIPALTRLGQVLSWRGASAL